MIKIICDCKSDCTGIAVLASIIIGIITAILTFTATITIAPVFYWVTFGIAVLFLALTYLVSALGRSSDTQGCTCANLPILLTGILGTVLTSLILLGVGFAATSVLGAIITGALGFFLSLILTTVACISTCSSDCRDCLM